MIKYQNNVIFTDKNIIEKAFKHHAMSPEDHMIEHQRGLFAGMDAKLRGAAECKEIIIRETLSGNFDYLKGFNQAIGKDMAKKAYSLIGKVK